MNDKNIINLKNYLFNDLRKATKEEYEEYIDYIESKNLGYYSLSQEPFSSAKMIYIDKEVTIQPISGNKIFSLLVKKGQKINFLKGHSYNNIKIYYMDERIKKYQSIPIYGDMHQFRTIILRFKD